MRNRLFGRLREPQSWFGIVGKEAPRAGVGSPGRRRRPLHLLALASLLGACSPRAAAESLLMGDHFTRTGDVAFGADPRQRLDVYRPRWSGDPSPVVIFLYGGRWQTGSRSEYRLLGDGLTRRGMIAVIPDYRLYPGSIYPAWVDDAAQAVRWTRENITSYGGDPERIFVVGHSAGAHTAALLALDERHLADLGAGGGVAGFVSLAGPVASAWTDADVKELMGGPAVWPETYPLNFIGGGGRPLLLLHGGDDETVSQRNSTELAARIRDRGGCARAAVYEDVGHVEIAVAFVLPWLRIAPIMDEVTTFVRDPVAATCPMR